MTSLRSKGPLALLLVVILSSCAFTLDFDELQEGGETEPSAGSGAVDSGGDTGSAVGGATGTDGGSPGMAGAGGDAGIALEDAAAALAGVLCSKLESCVGAAAFKALSPIEDCAVSAGTSLANTIVANIQQSVEMGTLVYDGGAMPGCLDAYMALPCEEFSLAFPEACKLALDGLSPEGGDCTHGLECEADLYCAGDACPATCTAPLQDGADCTATDVCAAGLVCFQDVCAPLGGDGDDCLGDVMPDCVVGFACFGADAATMTPGTCFPYTDVFVLSEGQSCTTFGTPALCEVDTYCAGGECVGPAESGGACQAAFPDMCPPGEYCMGSTCTPLPGPNDACRLSLNSLDPMCAAYLRCVNFVCRQLAEIGEPCGGPAECYSGACGSEGECVPSACQ